MPELLYGCLGGCGAYLWNPGVGFGTKLSNPSVPPGLGVFGLGLNPTSSEVLVGGNASPYVHGYAYTPGVGYGAKYANPITLPAGEARTSKFCPNGTDVAFSFSVSAPGGLWVYSWTPGVGFGTKYPDPLTFPNCWNSRADWNGTTDISISYAQNTPFIQTWPWTPGVGFGVVYTDPTEPIPHWGRNSAFRTSGVTDLACSHYGVPRITVWPFTPGVGYGVKYAPPLTYGAIEANRVEFCNGTDIATSNSNRPYTAAYPWTPGVGFGVKYTTPLTPPTGFGQGLAFCGSTDLAIAHSISPFITAYPWTPGVGYGIKYANPAVLPEGSGAFGGFEVLFNTISSGQPYIKRVQGIPGMKSFSQLGHGGL